MKTNLLFTIAAVLGAAAILWMGIDFVGANGLALLVTLVIGFVYALGQLELVRFRGDTAAVRLALGSAPVDSALAPWLAGLPATLRNAVGQRIEGERVGLPAPVFSPYLVGLLVMLGLLGTFVGMVDTLSGAVIALEGSTELAAIRQGLAAPIEGLSLAFGTSVAGVAASAMLGLNATISRRERMQVTRQLDTLISGELRQHSLSWHRQQTYNAMQQQAEALPRVAERLEAMAGELERMGNTLGEQLQGNQQQFLDGAQNQYQALATEVGQSLRDSLAESGRLAGESIAPVVEQTLARLADHSEDLHSKLQSANKTHLDSVQAELERSSQAMISQLGETGQAMASAATSSSDEMVAKIGQLLAGTETLVQQRAANEAQWLEQQSTRMNELTEALRSELSGMREEDRQRSAANLEQLTTLQGDTAERLAQLQQDTSKQLEDLHQASSQALQKLDASGSANAEQLQASLAQSLAALQELTGKQLSELSASTSSHLANLSDTTSEHLSAIGTTAADQLTKLTDETAEQLSALESTASSQLGNLTGEASAHLAALESTAANHLASLGQELEEPMTRLIETASETPRAAAEVIGKLHEEVSNNLERDNALLEERQQIMADLAELSKTIQSTTAAQQAAIGELVSTTTGMLGEVSENFQSSLTQEATRLSDLTVDVAGSAAEMASLGEAFGLAVQLYSESNTQLMENLSRIEESMEKSTERSDEQMSYYVAQAREIIDQSMLSQREIIEELRRLGQTGDLFAEEAAG